MSTRKLQDVPDRKLRMWLAAAEQALGRDCQTAKTYRAEVQRRHTQRKAVRP